MENTPYRERLRILLIIYYFSEPFDDPANPNWARVFRSEVKIQKIDFLFRYPSYFCNELLREYEEKGTMPAAEIRDIVWQIFADDEPQLRTDEMKKFLFGAYDELDTTLSFLKAWKLIDLRSERTARLWDRKKEYFVTHYGVDKIEKGLAQVPAAQWYISRCRLIKYYLGYLSGSELKRRQYDVEAYGNTPKGTYIDDIEHEVRAKFYTLFHQHLPL